jgi:putative exporter of polyketide antibiotics
VTFIGKVREGIDGGMELAEAVKEAVKYCEERQILQQFLAKHATEVMSMLTTEFRLEDAKAVWQEEIREEYETLLASKDAEITSKDAEIVALRTKLNAQHPQ